jgi:hypothetical protein
MAKNNKETYERDIRPIFQLTEKLRTEGLGEWLPFSVAEPQDMKLLQLCLTRGGAAQGKSFLCHLCHIYSDDITVQQQVCCSGCHFLDKCFPRSLLLSSRRGSIVPLSGPAKPHIWAALRPSPNDLCERCCCCQD